MADRTPSSIGSTSLRSTIVNIIRDIKKPLPVDLTDPARPLLSNVLDSLDFAILVMTIEEKFNSSLKILDAGQMNSIDNIVSYLESRAPEASP